MKNEQTDFWKLLARTHFAEGFSEKQVQSLARTARLVELQTGAALFREGDWEDNAFVVLSGQITLKMQIPRNGTVQLLTADPGDLVGWSGVISDGRMTATAVAAEETTLIALSGRLLQDLCETDPELGCVLMTRIARILARRLLATRLQLLDHFCGSDAISEADLQALASTER